MYRHEKKNDWDIIYLEDRITLPNSDSVKQFLKEKIHEHQIKRLILDLKKLEFVDSTGIGVLISIYKTLMEVEGQLVLSQPDGGVEKILNLTKIHLLIPIEPNLEGFLTQQV